MDRHRPSMSTVFSSRRIGIDRRYRPWQIDRSINQWIGVDIWIGAGTIVHYQWDHWILGGYVSGTIAHHLWDHVSRSMSTNCLSICHWGYTFFEYTYKTSTVDRFFFCLNQHRRSIFTKKILLWIVPTVNIDRILRWIGIDHHGRYWLCSPVGESASTVDSDRDI